ncbi:MAG: hypothetical protein IC227_05565 [Enterococcus lacertideformus]|uniref:Uncharacterized protein n=1 Tax=Enterococcus lacertideformus TaxID=2771493 RepID=A0A931FAY4_9ENTE|nr:hypothetical protein [Enterococcus lacertideformus]
MKEKKNGYGREVTDKFIKEIKKITDKFFSSNNKTGGDKNQLANSFNELAQECFSPQILKEIAENDAQNKIQLKEKGNTIQKTN